MILFLLPKSPKFHDLLYFFDLPPFLQVIEEVKYIVLSFLVYDSDLRVLSFILCTIFIAIHCRLLGKLNLLC